MKKVVIIILSIISALYLYINNKNQENIIPEDAIRFRVVANSNTIYDQNIKIQVKNVVQNKILELIKDSKDMITTRKIIQENIKSIDLLVKETLEKLNYNKKYKIKYGLNYFPNKEFKGLNYKKGKYESLVITIGEGQGDNWWCVLFPPLCINEVEEANEEKIEYTSFIKEFIGKYITSK